MLALLGAANMTCACEWLMGGIPHEQDELEDGDAAIPPSDDGGSVRDAAGPSSDASPLADASSDSGPSSGPGADRDSGAKVEPKDAGAGDKPGPGDDRDAAPAGDRDSGAPIDRDSGAPPTADAGVDSAVGGEEPVVDSGTSCDPPILWYPDKDKDGYGDDSVSPQPGCQPPDSSGEWAWQVGDCQDRDARVHPEQMDHFGDAYRTPSGADSFDYDCSKVEDGSGGQKESTGNCGLLGLTACDQGSGYEPTARSGVGVNQYCGSKTNIVCSAALLGLVCEQKAEPIGEPYRCK